MILKAGSLVSPTFLAFVRSLPCAVCEARGVDPHHFPSKGASGVTRDDLTAPLCRQHHDMAQSYIYSAEQQRSWVDQTRALFLERASPDQMAAFYVDWKRWRITRGELVPV